MSVQLAELNSFYHGPRGLTACRMIRNRIKEFWPDLSGRNIMGFGYAMPYLVPFLDQAERVLAFMPQEIGAQRWPLATPNHVAMVDSLALPLPDLSLDYVVVVHGLEMVASQRGFFREIWRVLKDDGRLMLIVPRRGGAWAHEDTTPFGQGLPFSRGQLSKLLTDNLFVPLGLKRAVYIPPFESRFLLKSSHIWEHMGQAWFPRFAGITLMEAAKQLYGAMPAFAGSAEAKPRRIMITDSD